MSCGRLLRFLAAQLLLPHCSIGFPGGSEAKLGSSGLILTTLRKEPHPHPQLWSWLVQVRITTLSPVTSTKTSMTCVGVILEQDKILLPAHCLFLEDTALTLPQDDAEVILTLFPDHGQNRKSGNKEVNVTTGIRSILHPDFIFSPGSTHDIAVLQLQEALPPHRLAPPLSSSTTLGYRRATSTTATVIHIHTHQGLDLVTQTSVRLLDLGACSAVHAIQGETQLCASDPHNTIHLGDSGSPLICYDTDILPKSGRLCGIVSYGLKDKAMNQGQPHPQPVVYTNLSAYLGWLNISSPGASNPQEVSNLGRGPWSFFGVLFAVTPFLLLLSFCLCLNGCGAAMLCRSRGRRKDSTTTEALLA